MKRLLAGLVPWMVLSAAAAQDAPRPAQVVYAHFSPSPSWRIGAECYVAPSTLANWGWSYQFVGSQATVQAEGKSVTVAGRMANSRLLVPLSPIFKSLDAGSRWRPEGDVFEAWGKVRSLSFREGKFEVDSTLPTKPKVSVVANPNRVVIDLPGTAIEEGSKLFVERGRAYMADPTTVRVALDVDRLPTPAPTFDTASRSFSLDLGAYAAEAPATMPPATPPVDSGAAPQGLVAVPVQDPQPEPVTPEVQPALPVLAKLAYPKLLSENASSASLAFSTDVPLSKPVTMSRPDPNTLELKFEGAEFVPSETPVALGEAVTAVVSRAEGTATVLTLTLARPMGIELSTQGAEWRLTLVKPNVGDGKLAGKIVVVDPGHGKQDSGTRSPDKKHLEKHIALDFAKKLSDELTKEGATVIMTRKDDTYIGLKERADVANRNAAHFFVSVHMNSNTRPESRTGGIVFHHKSSPMGKLLAECMHNELKGIGSVKSLGARSDGTLYKEGLAVLRHSTMPAVLLEAGFLNHSSDRKFLLNAEFQAKYVRAVVKGIKLYLGEVRE